MLFRSDVEFESQGIDFPAGYHDRVVAAVLRVFREHGINFAYPTQVNLVSPKTGQVPPPAPSEE